MKRLAPFATAATVLAATGPAAYAQSASRIDPAPGAVVRVEGEGPIAAIRATNRFARCSARDRRRASETLLAMPYASAEQARAAVRAFGGESECFRLTNMELRFNSLLLVGGMAEQLVLDNERPGLADRIVALGDEEAADLGLAGRTPYEQLGLCVARRNAPAVSAMIRTQPASDEEWDALTRLLPDLNACLPGVRVELEAPTARSLLAAGLYRALRTLAPRRH